MCLNYQTCMLLQLDDWDQIASITMQGVTVLANLSDLQAAGSVDLCCSHPKSGRLLGPPSQHCVMTAKKAMLSSPSAQQKDVSFDGGGPSLLGHRRSWFDTLLRRGCVRPQPQLQAATLENTVRALLFV